MRDPDADHHPSVIKRYEAAYAEAARLGFTLAIGGRGKPQFIVESRTAAVFMSEDIDHVTVFLQGVRIALKPRRAR